MAFGSYVSERVPLRPDDPPGTWSKFAVVWFGGIGFLAPIALFLTMWFYNTFVTRGALSTQWPPLGVSVTWVAITALSGGGVGGLVWHLVVERVERGPIWVRSSVAGALTAEFAAVLVAFVYFLLDSEGLVDGGLLEAAAVAIVFGGLYGLFLFGWLTIPLGIVAGYVLGSIRTDDG